MEVLATPVQGVVGAKPARQTAHAVRLAGFARRAAETGQAAC